MPTMSQGFRIPRRAPADESMFIFDSDMKMSTSPLGSLMSGHEDTQFSFGSLVSIEENSGMTSYPQACNMLQQQTRIDLQEASSQFTYFGPSIPTMHVNDRMSLLSQHLKDQGYAQTSGNPVATSPPTNQPSFPHSVGQSKRSPTHRFASPSLNTDERDQYTPLKFDDDLELLLLSPGAEVTLPPFGSSFDRSQVHSGSIPIGIPTTNKFHGRRAGLSNPIRPQHHPYRSPSYGAAESIHSPGSSFFYHVAKNFPPHQQQAVLSIMNYKQAHPDIVLPASYITSDLAEVHDGRGWCLIGNCGVDRAKQKVNLQYDIHRDTTRKRLDHLYDHIRDKHFNCRPFRCATAPCTQTFSRELDLKRHEKMHATISLPCDVCGKHYTREDNLKRHLQLKHPSVPGTSREFGSASFPYQ